MALDPYSKIHPGDVLPGIPGAPWNDMLDMIAEWKGGKMESINLPQPEPGRAGVLPIKNETGNGLSRFAVLGISNILFSPSANLNQFKNRPGLRGRTPTAADASKFAIVQTPLGVGSIGEAMLMGTTPVQVNVTNNAHTCAVASAGVTDRLTSAAAGGAEILWRSSAGTGLQWAIVRLPTPVATQVRLGSSATTVLQGATATFTLTDASTVTAGVWRGIAFKNKTYEIAVADDGNYYVVNPDTTFGVIVHTATQNVVGPTAPGAPYGSGVFDIIYGINGVGAPLDGVTLTAEVIGGWCLPNGEYICSAVMGNGSPVYRVTNPQQIVKVGVSGSAKTAVFGPAGGMTVEIYTGATGAETATGFTFNCYIRDGLVWSYATNSKLYKAACLLDTMSTGTGGTMEIIDPTKAADASGTIAELASGTATLYAESTVGNAATGSTRSAYNRHAATSTAGYDFRIEWNEDSKAWVVTEIYI